MREIKFRAWTEPENKMLTWNNLLNMNLHNALTIPEQCGLILMQYTGIKDKKGNEIYEGDIVIMHYFFENHGPDLGVFEDEAEITGTVYINEYHTFVKAKNGDVYSFLDYIQEPSEELEVIGNIYDNPELLGGSNE